MDTYQPIYDAVRSKISGCDIGQAIENAIPSSSITHSFQMIEAMFQSITSAMEAPSAIHKPRIYRDGDMWCALLGENIQEGICGFGKSPALACEAFDNAWYAKIPEPVAAKEAEQEQSHG